MNQHKQAWLTAGDAARALDVSTPTLYAYVSRGLIRSQAWPGSPRRRRYAREDVERLRRRAEAHRDPGKAAAHALEWGVPVLESAITLIDGRTFYYRGHDAVALAASRSFADVASLIWTGAFDAPLGEDGRDQVRSRGAGSRLRAGDPRRGARRLPFIARAQTILAAAAAGDPMAYDTRPGSVVRTGWRIVRLLSDAATGGAGSGLPLDERLASAWRTGPAGAEVLRNALILCADHELNVSSFTARCVASAGSSPYAVVAAGLAALEGPRHGGVGARVESMLAGVRRTPHLRRAIAERLQRGEPIAGFGHPLYPCGDPRAARLLDLLRARYLKSSELAFVLAFSDAASSVIRERPNVDFALAAVACVLQLPPGSPLALFAIGRSVGWIGHALEQYATGQLIRPRAKYVGTAPDGSRKDVR